MRVPDLEAEIDAWENAYSYEVMEMMRMTAKDMLFRKDENRMKNMVAAVFQIPDQHLMQQGEPPAWTPTLKKPSNNPKSI